MATFDKTSTGYRITDDAGQTINLSIEQSYELLQVLYNARDQLFALVHDLPGDPWMEETPESVQAWQRAKPAIEAYQRTHPFIPDSDEKPAVPPTMRMVEIRLYQEEWHCLDELKAVLPALHEDYEAPECRETGGAVKVLSVQYEAVSQNAIALINRLRLDYRLYDVLVPMDGDDDD